MTPASTAPRRPRSIDVVARTPPVPLALVLAALMLYLLWILDAFYVELGERWLIDLWRWSGGWLRPDMTHTAMKGVIVIGVLMMGIGRLRPRQLGLQARHARGWLLALVATWCGFQLVLLVASAVGGAPRWHLHLPSRFELQLLVHQLLVSTIVEEVFHRGFILPQLYHRLTRSLTPGRALAAAVALSSGIFALFHVPVLLSDDAMNAATLVGSLGGLVWSSAVFAWIYLRSGNLLVTAAVHAIINVPTPLLTAPADDLLTGQLRWVVQAGAALWFLLYPTALRPPPPED